MKKILQIKIQPIVRELNAFFIILLCLMISGAFAYQFAYHEAPCPLCLLQRLGMIAVIMGGVLNLKFGVRVQHYALAILGAMVGASVSIRQILLHIAPGSTPFGNTMDGFALYTWAFIAFVVSIFGCVLMMSFYTTEHHKKPEKLTLLDKFSIGYAGVIILANMIYTFIHCGFGACVG